MENHPPGRLPPDYVNPVFSRSFPDPFVLKFCGEYFGYCTGFAEDGLAIGVARSSNLTDWTYVGGALQPLRSEPPYYWAPEVVYSNGKFYMYYSCGNETLMELRVAVSDRPDGGFEDAGVRLTNEEFAIDAHVFVDDNGDRFMFYATDFLDHSHIGTGTVVDKMRSWYELEGSPRPVTRAAYDWHVYDPNRAEKGGVRWHTVEGPTVFKHKGKYLEMFSGGNWTNSSYGVAFASSDEILAPREWRQSIDGETLFPVLRTIPEKVVGPGHNSAVIGPNNRELYCVYHSWVGDERVMYIDRMGLVDSRIFVRGATYTPQPVPFPPSLTLESDELELTGKWNRLGKSLISDRDAESTVSVATRFSDLLFECSFRIVEWDESSKFSLFLNDEGLSVFELNSHGNRINGLEDRDESSSIKDFDPFAFHQISLEVSGGAIEVSLDGRRAGRWMEPANSARRPTLDCVGCAVEFASLAVTYGFNDLFEIGDEGAINRKWNIIGDARISFGDDALRLSVGSGEAILTRGDAFADFEFVINIRSDTSAEFGFALLREDSEPIKIFSVVELDESFAVVDNNSGTHLPLPSSYSKEEYRQFRIVKIGDELQFESEDLLIGATKVGIGSAAIGIFSKGPSVEMEMVRWTEIGK